MLFNTDQVKQIAKALRDDAAGIKQATLTDLDLAVAALTSLAKERDDLKAALVGQLIQEKRKEQEQAKPEPEGAWGKISESGYLSPRSKNALAKEGYRYLSELVGVDNIRAIPNIGLYCEKEILFAIDMTKKDLEQQGGA